MAFEHADAPAWQPLVDAAWEARSHAHAPYSGFKVGAALRTSTGDTSADATSRTPPTRSVSAPSGTPSAPPWPEG